MGITQTRFNTLVKSELPTSAPDGVPIFTTDTNELFVGAGDSMPLQRVNVSDPVVLAVDTDTTSIKFDGLDINAYEGYIVYADLLSASASYNCNIYFNNNLVNSNYVSQRLELTSATFSNKKASTPTFMYTTSRARAYAKVEVSMLGGYPVFNSTGIRATKDDIMMFAGRMLVTQDNVTSITISSQNTNGIKAGSRFLLYRRS